MAEKPIFVDKFIIKMKKITSFLLMAYCFVALFAQQQHLKIQKYTLPNGLTVYLNEDHTLPSVYGAVAVNAGGKYDPKEATGMGHYLEHMLFKGTTEMGTLDFNKEKPYLDKIVALYDSLGMTTDEKKRKEIQTKINDNAVKSAEFAVPNELDRMLKSIGSEGVNAFTAQELICYHNEFPPHEIDKWLSIYADRFVNPVFRLFQSELEVVYEEKNRGSDNMGQAIFETFNEHFFQKHPYGQSIIGKTEHLKNPSLSKMYEYYNTYYVANNMALIICGDFDSEQIKPIIAEKFGKWKTGNVPPFVAPKETAFKGKEMIKKRLSPINVGIMGFRTVPKGHADEGTLELVSYLLSNEASTGGLDKLSSNRKIMLSQAIPLNLNDEGAYIVIFVPKIFGQSLGNAQKLVWEQINAIKAGTFSETQLEAAKNQLKISFSQEMEDNQSRCFTIADLFTRKGDWNEFTQYPEKIDKITKAEIMRVANQYFGDNYLYFTSKMGFPKKDKLAKPGFKPVIPKEGIQSEYEKKFNQMPEKKAEFPFVDFRKDVEMGRLGNGLYYTENPKNDVFSFAIRYNIGKLKERKAEKLASYLSLVGSNDLKFDNFAAKMDSLGCKVGFEAGEEYFNVSLEGLEKNFLPAYTLLMQKLKNPELNEEKIKNLIDESKFEPRLFKREKQEVGMALREYVMYGNNSSYKKRLSTAETKALKAAELLKVWQNIFAETPTFHYVGKIGESVASKYIAKEYPTELNKASEVADKAVKTYTENTVYFIHDSKARQSQIHFFVPDNAYKVADEAKMDAFNSYFGGDMSSLMFQEIREFRSLAYSTRGTYNKPRFATGNGFFAGYIGCQGDKTMESIETLHGMLCDMPQKADRMNAIQKGLMARLASEKPDFRMMSRQIQAWKKFGYTEDPSKAKASIYPQLTFGDVNDFYTQHIKGKPMVIAIVGDKSKFDMVKLAKYGKVVEVKLTDVYNK